MFFILFYLFLSVSSETVIVETKKGKIRGETRENIHHFVGIPYSWVNPRNPFGRGETHRKFEKPFDAFNNTVMCAQILPNSEFKGVLQCLTLNIYTPQTEHFRLPVLVWFHGESMWYGDANQYFSPYLIKENIVLVTVNFRLGPYGFFCPNENGWPGNQALRDQRQALKWIQANIDAFNGDPNAVTIGGSGYGAGYVDLHIHSPGAKDLFNRAILQSGSIFSRGFFVAPNLRYVKIVAKVLGKGLGRHTTAGDCVPLLSRKTPAQVVETALKWYFPLGACKESKSSKLENIVTEGPFVLDVKDKVLHTKLLIGYNSLEMIELYAKNNTPEFYQAAGDIIYNTMRDTFNLDKISLDSLVFIIKRFYFGEKDYGPETMLSLAEAVSDFSVSNAVERSLNRFVKGSATVYKYLFSYMGASEYKNITGAGAPQGEEMKFLFDWKTPISGTEQEEIRAKMVKMWANFIKFGNPTPDHKPLAWEPVHGLARPYLNIDSTMELREDTFQRRNEFWHLLWHSYKRNAPAYY